MRYNNEINKIKCEYTFEPVFFFFKPAVFDFSYSLVPSSHALTEISFFFSYCMTLVVCHSFLISNFCSIFFSYKNCLRRSGKQIKFANIVFIHFYFSPFELISCSISWFEFIKYVPIGFVLKKLRKIENETTSWTETVFKFFFFLSFLLILPAFRKLVICWA